MQRSAGVVRLTGVEAETMTGDLATVSSGIEQRLRRELRGLADRAGADDIRPLRQPTPARSSPQPGSCRSPGSRSRRVARSLLPAAGRSAGRAEVCRSGHDRAREGRCRRLCTVPQRGIAWAVAPDGDRILYQPRSSRSPLWAGTISGGHVRKGRRLLASSSRFESYDVAW